MGSAIIVSAGTLRRFGMELGSIIPDNQPIKVEDDDYVGILTEDPTIIELVRGSFDLVRNGIDSDIARSVFVNISARASGSVPPLKIHQFKMCLERFGEVQEGRRHIAIVESDEVISVGDFIVLYRTGNGIDADMAHAVKAQVVIDCNDKYGPDRLSEGCYAIELCDVNPVEAIELWIELDMLNGSSERIASRVREMIEAE